MTDTASALAHWREMFSRGSFGLVRKAYRELLVAYGYRGSR